MVTFSDVEKPKVTFEPVPPSTDYTELIEKAAKKYNIDPLLLRAQMKVESGGNAKIQGPEVGPNKERAGGLFQIMPGTAKDLDVTDVFDPAQNIDAGARYLRQMTDHPSAAGDFSTGLMFYHGGRDPKNWGTASYAYPGKVLEEYRKLGGRLLDPEIPKGKFWQRAASAVLPFDASARLAKGSGPDLSAGPSGPEGNLPVGQKLKNWWDSTSPGLTRHRKSMANYEEENPLLSASADVLGSLPVGLAGGSLINGALKSASMVPALDKLGTTLAGPFAQRMAPALDDAASAAVAPWRNFLAGSAGRGAPLTGEGASLGTRAASGAANGALQGAALGGMTSFLTPQGAGEDMLDGAGTGAALGLALPIAGAGINRAIFGKRIDPTTARLGQDAVAGNSARPAVPLTADREQVNQLSLNPQQFSRRVGEMIKEPSPFVVGEGGRLTRARATIGKDFDTSLPQLYAAADQTFFKEFQALVSKHRSDANLIQALDKNPAVKHLKGLFEKASISDGKLSGLDYHDLLRNGAEKGVVAQLANSTNPGIRGFGQELRGIMHKAIDRGTGEQIQMLLQQGKPEEATKVVSAHALWREAQKKYKMIAPVEKSLDDVTQQVVPSKLATHAKKGGADLLEMGRVGKAFDPEAKVSRMPAWLPYAAVAAGTGAATQDPLTTGQAALGLAALRFGGKGAAMVPRAVPGYENALLRRSNTFGPGPLQSAVRSLGLPAGVVAGNRLLSQENERK